MRYAGLLLGLGVLLGCGWATAGDRGRPEKKRGPRVIEAAAVSPDGKYVVTAESEGFVTLWDTTEEQAPRHRDRLPAPKGLW